jgi:hypothetical protein
MFKETVVVFRLYSKVKTIYSRLYVLVDFLIEFVGDCRSAFLFSSL